MNKMGIIIIIIMLKQVIAIFISVKIRCLIPDDDSDSGVRRENRYVLTCADSGPFGLRDFSLTGISEIMHTH